MSCAAAWQLGRLIALNSASVAVRLMKARGSSHLRLARLNTRSMIRGAAGIANGAGSVGEGLLSALDGLLEKLK